MSVSQTNTPNPLQTITGKIIQVYNNDVGSFSAGKIAVTTASDLALVEDESVRSELYWHFESAMRNGDTSRYFKFRFFGTVAVEDSVTFTGEWVDDPKYGLQFAARGVTHDIPLDEEGLVAYIGECAEFRGIGPSKAKKLVQFFKPASEFADKIGLATATMIAKAAGISESDAQNFQLVWIQRSLTNAISTQLAHYELTPNQIEKIVNIWGNNALSILKTNPYQLIGEVEGFGFSTVDKIALRVGVDKAAPQRVEACLNYVVLMEQEEGHTWIDRGELVEKTNKLLILDCTYDEAVTLIEQALIRLMVLGIKESNDNRYEYRSGSTRGLYMDESDRISSGLVHYAEQLILTTTRGMGHTPNPHFSLTKFDPIKGCIADQAYQENQNDPDYLDTFWSMTLLDNPTLHKVFEGMNAGQKNALGLCLTACCVVVCGPGGTGKSTLVKGLVKAYADKGLDVSICAPTGKAAKRLEEVLLEDEYIKNHTNIGFLNVQTMHRLLQYDGQSFLLDEVTSDIVIIDEMSMVDSSLFAALCNRLSSTTSLVLVGDTQQLPPVGPGNPLRDIIRGGLCPVARLTEVVRQSGPLKKNCLALLEGRIEPSYTGTDAKGKKPWVIWDSMKEAEDTQRRIIEVFESHIERLGYDPLYEVQVLTAVKDGPLGVTELNRELQKVYQKKRGVVVCQNETQPDIEKKGRVQRSFYVGDRVIYTRNNYRLDVYNGDIGVVRRLEYTGDMKLTGVVVEFGARVEPKEEYITPEDQGEWPKHPSSHFERHPFKQNTLIVYSGGLKTITRADLPDLELAYCLTVHKYQGSQIPCVILVCHKSHSYMHDHQGRNWIYTGATRAQSTLVAVGDRYGLANAVSRDAVEKRRTWLSVWTNPDSSISSELSE